VVIVDHGSRRAASNDMLVEFCALYQQLTQHPIVEPAHMEIAEPTVAQAVGAFVARRGARVCAPQACAAACPAAVCPLSSRAAVVLEATTRLLLCL
jgi:sirohydrochlorin ferrochelatase